MFNAQIGVELIPDRTDSHKRAITIALQSSIHRSGINQTRKKKDLISDIEARYRVMQSQLELMYFLA
ncbi:MAG: hypothetical protein QN720_11385 [Nitrososphaeraceae archaeon]|nr:hypothetical protein [Nitrososphaeraceae archaeon]MDW0333542.1 hypothetical protein [Nitrososphaeraceae archaeon]